METVVPCEEWEAGPLYGFPCFPYSVISLVCSAVSRSGGIVPAG